MRMRYRPYRRIEKAAHKTRRHQTRRDADQHADDDAEHRTDQAHNAATPDTESAHDRQSKDANHHVIMKGRPVDVLYAEGVADADYTQLKADNRYYETADRRR